MRHVKEPQICTGNTLDIEQQQMSRKTTNTNNIMTTLRETNNSQNPKQSHQSLNPNINSFKKYGDSHIDVHKLMRGLKMSLLSKQITNNQSTKQSNRCQNQAIQWSATKQLRGLSNVKPNN
jgi:hypothetical protein